MRLDPTLVDAMVAWRRDLHAHPETAFEEHRTAAKVAEVLRATPGLTVHTGLARTGVVASLTGRHPAPPERAIALRADLDALHLCEANAFAHASQHEGRMHACGHDGHTAMLLGAARALAADPDFAGTVHFVFQPAEENEGGGRVMVEDDRLFERFPCEGVYGMHNWPGLPCGEFYALAGPAMAAFDVFEITVKGAGTHAAKPHYGVDPVVVAAQLVLALQTIASRSTDPLDAVVVSVTQVHGGDTWNVIPEEVVLRGTTRALDPEVHAGLEARMRTIVEGVCAAHGATGHLWYEQRYPVLVNTAAETEGALAVARAVVGDDKVHTDHPPSMGAEDFAFMLQHKPGCYIWLGAGEGPPLHNPRYDFNDAVLETGCAYWVELTRTLLAPTS